MSSPTIRKTGTEAYTDGTGSFQAEQIRVEHCAELTARHTIDVDVCVIGSGAGGGPAAKELAEGGLSVAILEEGKWWSTDEHSLNVADMTSKLYRDGSQTVSIGNAPAVLPVGQAVGGTTVINGATCFRTPKSVLEAWGKAYGLDGFSPDQLDPYFRRVERILNVSQIPPELAGKKTAVIKRGIDALEYSGDYLYRAVRGCVGSGICHWGCPTAAKQHVGITFMPLAWNAGATTYSGVRARKIEHHNGRASAVIASTAAGGKLRVRCERVVVAGGTFETPFILGKSGIGKCSGQLGKNLSIHPTPVVRGIFDEQIDPFDGVPQAYHMDHFAGEGILFEESPLPLPVAAISAFRRPREHHKTMVAYRNSVQFAMEIPDTSRGVVHHYGRYPLLTYNINRYDLAKIKRGLEVLADVMWAAGAKEVYLPISDIGALTDGDSTPLKQHQLKPHHLNLSAWHPLGTARAGSDPRRSVIGEDMRVHGFENIYVSDGSAMPSATGVNPQITIMTLATRMAYGILGKPAPDDEPVPEHIAQPNLKFKLPEEL